MVLRLLDTGVEAVEEADGIDAMEAVQVPPHCRFCVCMRNGLVSSLKSPFLCATSAWQGCSFLARPIYERPLPFHCPAALLLQYSAAPPELQQMAAALVDKYYGADNEP
jgi:hypothetical protein